MQRSPRLSRGCKSEISGAGWLIRDSVRLRRLRRFFANPQTNKPNTHMKTRIITALVAAFAVSIVQAAPETTALQRKLTVTPEIKRAFHSDDSIKIKSVTGTAPRFQTGGTYRIIGTCYQQTLKNATLYLGNTAEAGSDAIVAAEGSSLSKPLRDGST